MKHALYNEFYKARHSFLWAVPIAFFVVMFLWQLFSSQNITAKEQSFGYTNLLYQLPVMNSLVMPLMIAVISSRLCDMEIKGDTLKQLYTLQSKQAFFYLKYLHEAFYITLFVLLECLIVLFCGHYYHFTDTLIPTAFCQFGAVTLLVSLIILTIQHFLSLIFNNQIIPLIVGLCGSFLGLFSMFLPQSLSRWIIYSYFAAFMTQKMNWDPATREIWFTPLSFPIMKFVILIIFGISLFILCQKVFIKQEV